MSDIFEAKLSASGKIALPKQIRDALGVSGGDYVTFVIEGDSVRIVNSSIHALQTLQKQPEGEADRAGLTEDDIVALVTEVRKEK